MRKRGKGVCGQIGGTRFGVSFEFGVCSNDWRVASRVSKDGYRGTGTGLDLYCKGVP